MIFSNGRHENKPDFSARQIASAGVLTAMTVVTTVFTKIPVSIVQGYFNLGDTIILVAGVLSGGITGAFTGAAGSAIADILTGNYIFAPISLIVKGLEGYVAGKLANSTATSRGRPKRRRLMLALIVSACVMVAGYFIAESTVLLLFDRAFGVTAAVAELPFNLAQGGISVVLARLAIEGLKRSKIIQFETQKYL